MNATLEAMMANFNSYKASKTAKTAPKTRANRADLVARIMTIETRIGEMA